MLRYRLIIPILRGKNAPKLAARGVMVGLAVAMTPTVGAQMVICAAIWGIVRAVKPSWNFNLLIACAWTWTTNIFTVPPIYYAFFVTGRVMLGHGNGFYGYDAFMHQLHDILHTEADAFESLWIYVWRMIEAWGLPMVVGCIPWAIVLGWVGYVWTIRFIRNFRHNERVKLTHHDE